jgi:hypothetical protein
MKKLTALVATLLSLIVRIPHFLLHQRLILHLADFTSIPARPCLQYRTWRTISGPSASPIWSSF